MLVRSILAWFVFSVLLLLLAVATQADEFDTLYVFWSMLLSVPIGVCAFRGALSNPTGEGFHYPSISICVLSGWILGVGPSLIVEAPESYIAFNFTQLGLAWARALFMFWCLVFAAVAGAPNNRRISVRVRAPDFWAIMGCSAAILAYLIEIGLYSNYQSNQVRTVVESGSLASVCKVIGTPLTTMLPALCMLAYAKAPSLTIRTAAIAAFFLAIVALLLSTSRGAVVLAVVMCLSLARKLGLQFRPSIMVGLAAALPVVFVLIMAYRQTLVESEGATSVKAYVTTAAASTNTVAKDDAARSDAVASLSNNMRSRMWYGQQFSASVDEWLDNGPSMKGSLLAGIIRAAPVWLFPGKNRLAEQYEFEEFLIATGRFPVADLGPMPWQQWLFEFGIAGLLFGALFYGYLARVIDRRLSETRSVYEVVFWLGMFVAMCAPEQTTDALILSGRIIAAFLIFCWAIALGFRVFEPAGRAGFEAEPAPTGSHAG
ncbi:MAG TPA: hypothetical protein VJR89_43525 [Polyangiales bacterium]|nr:hypothetical protein [Polyangiales bacterium]